MEPVDRQEILREAAVGVVAISVRYHASFFTAVMPQLQLWRLHWLLSVQSVGNLHPQLPYVLHLASHGDAAAVVETD